MHTTPVLNSLLPFQSAVARLYNLIYGLKNHGHKPESLHSLIDESSLFKNNLETLIKEIEQTSKLTPFGHSYVRNILNSFIKTHRRLNRFWTEHPSVFDEQITNPIVILGLPRSGTTFLFNLLSRDSQFQHLRNWETFVSPVPFEHRLTKYIDFRRLIGTLLVSAQSLLAPQLKTIHEFTLDGPEECTPILMQTFLTQALDPMFAESRFGEHLNSANFDEAYSYHKKFLQTLQFQKNRKPWLLKSPDHIAGIQSLLKTYPQAQFVHLYRDPSDSVASWASLNAAFRGIWLEKIDHDQLGHQTLARLSFDMNKFIDFRKNHPTCPIHDVFYENLTSDPIAAVKSMYKQFKLKLTKETEYEMTSFLSRQHTSKSSHKYSLEMFGLNRDAVRSKFENYITTFNIKH